MRKIMTYETFVNGGNSFVNDDNRDQTDFLPSYNPVNKVAAQDYVQNLSPTDKLKLYKNLDIEEQEEIDSDNMDDEYDEMEDEAIDRLSRDPYQVGPEPQVKGMKVNGGDGVVRNQRIGGSSFANSLKVGE